MACLGGDGSFVGVWRRRTAELLGRTFSGCSQTTLLIVTNRVSRIFSFLIIWAKRCRFLDLDPLLLNCLQLLSCIILDHWIYLTVEIINLKRFKASFSLSLVSCNSPQSTTFRVVHVNPIFLFIISCAHDIIYSIW